MKELKELLDCAGVIYSRLEDEISRKLFIARLNLSATGDWGYITQLPMEYKSLNADIAEFGRALSRRPKKRAVIFGAGNNGKALAAGFRELDFDGFIDNYRGGVEGESPDGETGLPIYTLEGYRGKFGLSDTTFFVSVFKRESGREIVGQLMATGEVKREDIVCVPPDWRNNTSQYFDFFTPRLNESFVDCGCFDGRTALGFAAWCGLVGYKRIWAFEPDGSSFENCKRTLSVLGRCEVNPYGVSDSNGEASFMAYSNEDSRIVQENCGGSAVSIRTVALDDFLKGEEVTLIKMDIEGAECDALKGASNIIKEQKPRLAISVYHRKEDILAIPRLLLSLRPDYKLYLRHYSLLPNETVLYAE